MSQTNSDSSFETFCSGDPLEYAMKGVKEIPSRERRSNKSLTTPIKEQYGTSVQDETASVLKRLYSAVDATALVRAVQHLGIHEMENPADLLTDEVLDDLDVNREDADLGTVMSALDVKLHTSLCPRTKDASKVSKKKQRESFYVPELIIGVPEGGTVYMAKTVSTSDKVRMAWDLHDGNEVVVVNDYDKWERLLGWQKLKQFPHGKNKIREEYGDKLSPEVLDIVAGQKSSDSSENDSSSTGSNGRRTRTKPSDEVLNVARDSRHRKRFKRKSQEILKTFEDGEMLGGSRHSIEQLILFPTSTDLNMTDHWWVPGSRWPGGGNVAIANCNKGTFEYLNQREEVWHIEDYLDQAGDYEFETNHGPVTMDTVEHSTLVLHVMSEALRDKIMAGPIDNMPQILPQYCDDEMYHSPEFPHADDMLYAPVTQEDVFWMRPELIDISKGGDDPIVLYADTSPRNIGKKWSLSSDYKLYARARLPNWDFDSTEMETLDGASFSLGLEKGGFEVVETLAMLHDNGIQPFSETPKARWS